MAKSNEQIKKVCEWCGDVFYAQKITTRYCSHTFGISTVPTELRMLKLFRGANKSGRGN